MNAIRTTHNLDFEVMPWNMSPTVKLYRVGTCHGQWMHNGTSLSLISIINDQPGNGHLEDVFEWFEFAAKRDGIPLFIEAFMNEGFKKHCVQKRGYISLPHDRVFKLFTK